MCECLVFFGVVLLVIWKAKVSVSVCVSVCVLLSVGIVGVFGDDFARDLEGKGV